MRVGKDLPLLLIPPLPPLSRRGGRNLFADENKDAGGQRHKIDEENGWPERQAEAQKAVEDQVDREQNHADVFVEFHEVDLLDHLPG